MPLRRIEMRPACKSFCMINGDITRRIADMNSSRPEIGDEKLNSICPGVLTKWQFRAISSPLPDWLVDTVPIDSFATSLKCEASSGMSLKSSLWYFKRICCQSASDNEIEKRCFKPSASFSFRKKCGSYKRRTLPTLNFQHNTGLAPCLGIKGCRLSH